VPIEWDPAKDASNRAKHEIGFDEATELFESGADYLLEFDIAHSDEEERFLAIGPIGKGIVVVVFTEPGPDVTRIISARLATNEEKVRLRSRMSGG
jgi:hypothetical protein